MRPLATIAVATLTVILSPVVKVPWDATERRSGTSDYWYYWHLQVRKLAQKKVGGTLHERLCTTK